MQDKVTKVIIYKGKSMANELFQIPLYKGISSLVQPHFLAHLGQLIKSAIWHHRLGHPTHAVLSSILHKSNVSSVVYESCTMCSACIHGKMSRLHFSEKTCRSLCPFDKIHLIYGVLLQLDMLKATSITLHL